MTLSITQLEEKCLWVRRKVLEMAVKANSGHVSTAMSQTEILVSLYFGGVLRYDPTNPKWEGRDIFLISKGQGGIGLYPVLASAGFFPESDLDNFCGEGSHTGVHAEWHCPGIEMISGSLGHGLPIATGIAQAFKNEGKDNLVFVLTGDGELHEGSNWEALLSAAWLGLDNIVVIVDRNGQLTLGKTDDRQSAKDGVGLNPLSDKFRSFGFDVWSVNGHDIEEVVKDLTGLSELGRGKVPGAHKIPKVLIANTEKGHGLSCMQDKRLWHYRVPSGKDLDQCWDDLKVPTEARPTPSVSQVKHATAMRDSFFDTLYERFKQDKKMVLIAADNGFPTIEKWAETLPNQFYQVGIAEQQMVGMAAGMAMQGYKPFCYAIAPFVTTRVHEFVKLDVAAMNLPITMVGVGAGYAYDIMGPTHHTAEDIAIMRALPNMNIFSPCDGPTASAIARYIGDFPSYVRLDRGGLDDIYDPSQGPVIHWGMAQLRKGAGTKIVIASTGVMTHTAMQVAKEIDASVVDVYMLKPLDAELLVSFLGHYDYLVTIEEHRFPGGFGSIIAEVLMDNSDCHLPMMKRFAAEDRFVFELGGREVIHKNMGLDAPSIVKKIKEWID